jgi:hypothetical protein
MVSFEGRRYSVPFRFVRQEVEVRGLAGRVQILKPVLARWKVGPSCVHLTFFPGYFWEGGCADGTINDVCAAAEAGR